MSHLVLVPPRQPAVTNRPKAPAEQQKHTAPRNPKVLQLLSKASAHVGPQMWNDVPRRLNSTTGLMMASLELLLSQIDYDADPAAPLAVVAYSMAMTITSLSGYRPNKGGAP